MHFHERHDRHERREKDKQIFYHSLDTRSGNR